MAIRIDLLPRYVAMRRWFKRIVAICLMLVTSFAAVLFLIYYREQLRLQTLQANVTNIRPLAEKADAAQKSADALVAQAQPLQTTVNFFVDAGRSGSERAALLDLIRRYIYNGAVIGTLDISDGANAKFTGMVRTPDDYARFLLNLRQGTTPTGILFAKLPDGDGIRGWPAPAPAANAGAPANSDGTATPVNAVRYEIFPNNITATAQLREPIAVPVPPGDVAPGATAPAEAPRTTQ